MRSRPSKNESNSSSALRGRLFPKFFVFRQRPSGECTKRYPQSDRDRPGSIDICRICSKEYAVAGSKSIALLSCASFFTTWTGSCSPWSSRSLHEVANFGGQGIDRDTVVWLWLQGSDGVNAVQASFAPASINSTRATPCRIKLEVPFLLVTEARIKPKPADDGGCFHGLGPAFAWRPRTSDVS